MKTNEYKRKYEQAKNYYLQQNISISQAAKEFHIDAGRFSQNLKKDGIKIINKQNYPRMNECFFDVIDNEEKAYWLGFLYADGYVGINSNHIELSLKSDDFLHLKKFAKALEFTKEYIYKDSIKCRLNFRNKHMHQQLVDKGCVPRKSLILTFPTEKQVPSELLRHFVRGYVDGDGSVMMGLNHKGERIVPRLSILGTESFLQDLITAMGWKKNKISHPSGAFSTEWRGKYVYNYLEDLYESATIFLDRKYQRYLYFKTIFADNKSLN